MSQHSEKPISESVLPEADLEQVSGGLFNTASDYINGTGNIFGGGSSGGSSGGQLIAHEATHVVQPRPR